MPSWIACVFWVCVFIICLMVCFEEKLKAFEDKWFERLKKAVKRR